MKKIKLFGVLTLIILYKIQLAMAIQFDGADIHKFLDIYNKKNSTEIYIRNYQNKKFLLYKSNFVYPENAVIGLDHEKDQNLLSIIFPCGKNKYLTFCNRFFNYRTSQMSAVIPDILGYNPEKNVVAYHIQSKDLVVLTPLFEKCDHPLTYKIKIYPDTDFGVKTEFLNNGDLQLDYVNLKNDVIVKAIPINYQQLYKNCGLKINIHGSKITDQ